VSLIRGRKIREGVVPAIVALASVTSMVALLAAVLSLLHNVKAPWIMARGMGLGAEMSLALLTVVGIWRRHPLRKHLGALRPAALATSHTVLASLTMVLVTIHVVAICADPYAKVGVLGALIPMESPYRPWPVTLGTMGLWLLLAIWGTARLSTSIAKRSWKAVHRAGVFTFGVVWLHALTTGTDAAALRPVMVIGAGVVFGAWISGVVMTLWLRTSSPVHRSGRTSTR
jgi:methionine sulfoxide reductase heme-binding subunit